FTQNNNIPTINQVIDAENDCDQLDEQSAEGSNGATCRNGDIDDNEEVRNFIDSITQTNEATATHVDDIFQDNTGSFSQVMTLNNGCDATTFSTSGDNDARCENFGQNFIGPVLQINAAIGLDDVLIDQDNNVAVSQDLSVNNDCDATASNFALCFNSGGNAVESITQANSAIGDGFADISQNNDAAIVQNIDLLNSCDESGDGEDNAECFNTIVSARNSIGPVYQANYASGADSFTASQSNVAQVTQNLQATNDCDEENTGSNSAECDNNFNFGQGNRID